MWHRSTSATAPPPSAKRLASNSGLVRGTIGQAEDMGKLLGAASADVVDNAKAAALQVPPWTCQTQPFLGMVHHSPASWSPGASAGSVGKCGRRQGN